LIDGVDQCHQQAHRGGCGIGRDHAHAPNHARVLAGRWRRRWVRRCRGRVAHLRPKNASTAEGVPTRRSSRGGINKWTCSLPHETVFCVGGGEGGPSFFTSPVRFVCGAVVPGGASSSSRERCAERSATSLGQLRPSGVRHLEVEVGRAVRLGKVVELLQSPPPAASAALTRALGFPMERWRALRRRPPPSRGAGARERRGAACADLLPDTCSPFPVNGCRSGREPGSLRLPGWAAASSG